MGLRAAATAAAAAPRLARRHGSTAFVAGAASAADARTRALFYGGAAAASAFALYLYATDTRAGIHRWVVPPLLRLAYADAEDGHRAGTALMKLLFQLNLHPRERASSARADVLSLPLFGTQMSNPIGISAGLDKDGEIADALFALGPAVVEIGGCTPRPQAGNPRPRVFRVPALDGIVNRYGLNSRGADDVALRLRNRLRRFARSLGVSESAVLDGDVGVPPGSLQPGRLLAVQVAKNKETDERDPAAVARDYVHCVRKLARYADIIVVNVSSPNTPGLRSLQATEPLTRLLSAVVDEASRTDRKAPPRVMVKVSPDEDEDAQMEDIAQAVHLSGVDGIIVGNTTRRREGLVHEGVQLTRKEQAALMEQGGYSGPAMFGRILDLVRRYRKLLDAQSHLFQATAAGGAGDEPKVIFATGGITNGDQALRVLNAGASVAMVYTKLVYGGAGTVTRIKAEMKQQLRAARQAGRAEMRREPSPPSPLASPFLAARGRPALQAPFPGGGI